jgi:hypothetical protein
MDLMMVLVSQKKDHKADYQVVKKAPILARERNLPLNQVRVILTLPRACLLEKNLMVVVTRYFKVKKAYKDKLQSNKVLIHFRRNNLPSKSLMEKNSKGLLLEEKIQEYTQVRKIQAQKNSQ